MLACPVCDCHVRVEEMSCPHCGAAIGVVGAPRSSRVGVMALSAGLGLFGCGTNKDTGDTVVEGSTTMMDSTTTDSTSTDSGTSSTDTTTTTGDGDGDWAEEAAYGIPEIPCGDLESEPVVVGDNAISIDTMFASFYQSCGGVGTASLYSFTADADGAFEVAVVDADFQAPVLSVIGFYCDPPDELGCTLPPETLMVTMTAGETVYIGVGTMEQATDGVATLSIVDVQP